MIRQSYAQGGRDALSKLGLAAPSPVDQLVAGVEHGKDVPSPGMAQGSPAALDGTIPLQIPGV